MSALDEHRYDKAIMNNNTPERYTRIAIVLLSLFLFSSVATASQSVKPNALEFYGVLEQGGVLVGKANSGDRVFINDRELTVSEHGYYVTGFGRDAVSPQTLRLITRSGAEYGETLQIKQREYKVQRIDGVPQKTVSPSEESLARIRQETKLVKSARNHILERTDFLSAYVVPSDGRITGVYGSQRVYNGVPKRPHYGIDYAGPHGAPVIAPAAGVVTLVQNDMYYSGGTLIVDHGLGLSSTFIHLSDILVAEGDEVVQGQQIAKIGSGGRSTGPHLDWRMNWLDQRIDPALMLKLKLPSDF